jgi:hypothetical protein
MESIAGTMDLIGVLSLIVGMISLMGIGVLMAGSFLWPDVAQKYKGEVVGVVSALVPIAIASLLIAVARAASGS